PPDPQDRFSDRGRGLRQHCMERCDERLLERLEEGCQVVLEGVAPDAVQPELVLDVDQVNARSIELLSHLAVALRAALTDPPANVWPVGVDRSGVVDRGPTYPHRRVGRLDSVDQVAGERRDSALPRRTG